MTKYALDWFIHYQFLLITILINFQTYKHLTADFQTYKYLSSDFPKNTDIPIVIIVGLLLVSTVCVCLFGQVNTWEKVFRSCFKEYTLPYVFNPGMNSCWDINKTLFVVVHIFVAVHIGFSYVAAVFVDLVVVVVVVDNVVAMALLVVNDHIVLSCGQ